MRFIYIILLGMLVFNGMAIIFAPFFPAESTGILASADNPMDEYSSYENLGLESMIGDMILTGGGVFVGAIAIAVVTQNVVWIGAGSFIAFIAGLWAGLSRPLTGIIGQFSYEGVSLYHLFVICLGILVVASVIEMFIQQRGAD